MVGDIFYVVPELVILTTQNRAALSFHNSKPLNATVNRLIMIG